MPEAVPVSMGSPEFVRREVGPFLFTDAWFPPGASLPPHVHDRATFATILEGSFDLVFTSPTIRHRRRPCPPGTVFTEPVGERHANLVSEFGARAVVIQPDPGAEQLLRPCAPMLDRINHFSHGGIELRARRLRRELAHPDDVTPLALEALALEMLAAATRLDPEERRAGDRPRWLLEARDYVHAHFREAPRIADVGEAVGIHPSHLARVFRREYGVPLGRYVRRLRIAWAADQLVESDASLSTIAYRAGFADQSHFTRRFRRATGMTPGAYRQRRRG